MGLQVAQRAAGAGVASGQRSGTTTTGASSSLYLVDNTGRVRGQVCCHILGPLLRRNAWSDGPAPCCCKTVMTQPGCISQQQTAGR